MKWFIFSVVLCAGLAFVVPSVFAETPDSVDENEPELPSERHREHYIDRWNSLIPHYAKIHYAGGMGAVSVGVGWDYGKNQHWETDLMIGLLPRFSGDRASATFTIKQNYIPWRIPLSSTLTFEPLETGLFMNVLISRNFWAREPEKYNGPYYRFATNTRFNIFVGQRLKMTFDGKSRYQSLTAFYEIGSCDLYLISAATNRTLSIVDIINLSFGIKFQFF